MGQVEQRLHALDLVLPAPMRLPPGTSLPFPWVRMHGNRAFLSARGPLAADGTLAVERARKMSSSAGRVTAAV